MFAGHAAAVMLVMASPAEDAQKHADEADRRAQRGDLEGAKQSLRTAHELHPNPFYLFALGVLAKEDGDCLTATALFRETLATLAGSELDDESKRDTERAARAEILACAAADPRPEPPGVDAAAGRPVAAADPVVTADPAVAAVDADPSGRPAGSMAPPGLGPRAPRPDSTVRRRSGLDRINTGFIVSGSLLSAAGIGFLSGAAALDANAVTLTSARAVDRSNQRAAAFGVTGLVSLSVGASLVVAGIIRHVIQRRANHRGARATKRGHFPRRELLMRAWDVGGLH